MMPQLKYFPLYGQLPYKKKNQRRSNLHSIEEPAGMFWISISDKFCLSAWELRIKPDHEDGWLIMQPGQPHQQPDPLLHGECG